MQAIAVLGAGELGAALARRLAERESARRVVLIDEAQGRARGKALDIRQGGPVEGADCEVSGAASWAEAQAPGRPFDVLVVAEAEASPGTAPAAGAARALAALTAQAAQSGTCVVFAGAAAPAQMTAALSAGAPRERVLGSAPIAWQRALRLLLAQELDVAPSVVVATVCGLPPDGLVAPRAGTTAAGLEVDALSPLARRRALEALRRRAPGPLALAAAAEETLRALGGSAPRVLPVTWMLRGECGLRHVVLAVPARLARGGVQGVLEPAFDPVERLAFESAAARAAR